MNIVNIINELEKVDPEVYERLDGRRAAVKNLTSIGGKLALAAVPLALGSLFSKAYGRTTAHIVPILNFALTLEFLEAEFYVEGINSGVVPTSMGDRTAIMLIRDHELAHVAILKQTIMALGGSPVAKPMFDFTAGGTFADVFTNYATFLAVSQTFEDTGVRAYKGQATNLMDNNEILRAALRIHSVEGRHAAHIREMRNRNFGVAVKPWITLNQSGIGAVVAASYAGEENTNQGGVEITMINGFDISREDASEAFDEPLTKEQVLAIVKPFIVG